VFHDLQDSYWHEKASQKYQARKLLIGQKKKNEKYLSDKLVHDWHKTRHFSLRSAQPLSEP